MNDCLQKVRDYFANRTQEQIERDWNEIEDYEIGENGSAQDYLDYLKETGLLDDSQS